MPIHSQRLRCSRKEPCKLFSARRRHEQIDEVNANTICQCPRDHSCPRHHTEPGVLPGITYASEDIRTYHGYCMQEPPPDTFRFVGDKDWVRTNKKVWSKTDNSILYRFENRFVWFIVYVLNFVPYFICISSRYYEKF